MISEPLAKLDELSVRMTCLADTLFALNLAQENSLHVPLPRYAFSEPAAQLCDLCAELRNRVEDLFEEQRTSSAN